jgi:hypothetical protein
MSGFRDQQNTFTYLKRSREAMSPMQAKILVDKFFDKKISGKSNHIKKIGISSKISNTFNRAKNATARDMEQTVQ